MNNANITSIFFFGKVYDLPFYDYLCRMNSGLYGLIDKYTKLILAIEDDEDSSPQWLCFYRIQMTIWIMQMSGHCDNLTQVHEVYTRIKEAWSDMYSYLNSGKFRISDRENLFSTVCLDLPGKNDPELTLLRSNGSF